MKETGDLKVPQEEGIITKDSLHGELGVAASTDSTTILLATNIDSDGNSCISGLNEPTAFK
jgi:hypothetical protein